MISKILDRVIHINIQEKITSDLCFRIQKGLSYTKFHNYRLIAVSVDSEGGSLIQAKKIVSSINFLSDKTLAPIYCFAGSKVFNSANVILTCGNKVYADKFSRIGDFGYTQNISNFHELLENNKWILRAHKQGDKKVRLNPTEPIQEEDIQWAQQILNEKEQYLKAEIMLQRKNRFEELKLNSEQISDLLNQPAFQSNQAVQHGFVDGIQNFDEFILKKYSGVKIQKVLTVNLNNFKNELIEKITFQE